MSRLLFCGLAALLAWAPAARAATTAAAGPDRRVLADDVVVLDGSGSTSDAGALAYAWTQLSGPAVSLNDPAAASPAFVAPSPAADQQLVFRLTVTAGTESDLDTATVVVRPAGHPLLTSQPDSVAWMGAGFTYAPALRNGPATWTLAGPPGAAVDPSTGVVSWMPAAAGAAAFTLTATTAAGADQQVFTVTAVQAPSIVSTPAPALAAYSAYQYDADGMPEATGTPPLAWSKLAGPADLVVRRDTGEVVWTPTQPGAYAIELGVESPWGSDVQSFTVTVTAGGTPAIAGTANLVAVLGKPYLYDADSLVDVTGTPPITFERLAGPAGFFVDPATGYVAWIPAVAGPETITLRAKSALGAALYTFTVDVAPAGGSAGPVAVIASSVTAGTAPLDVSLDGAGSQAGDAPIISYKWDFGDGSPPVFGPTVSRSYAQPGGYQIQLTVVDAQGRRHEAIQALVVKSGNLLPPVARIGMTSVSGSSSLSARFECECQEGSSPIALVRWDYGDGDVSTQWSPTHTFTEPGGYTVRLTVLDANGLLASDKRVVEVSAGSALPPVVQAFVDPGAGEAPLLAHFGAISGGQGALVVKREWTFSDGERSLQLSPVRQLSAPGVLVGEITVTDANGLSSSDRVEVEATSGGLRAPRILSSPALTGVVGLSWTYDEDGLPAARGDRPLTWELGVEVRGERLGAPEGMRVDPATGELSWSPPQPGAHEVTLLARNAQGFDLQRFTVEVSDRAGGGGAGCGCGAGAGAPGGSGLVALGFWALARRQRRPCRAISR